MFQRFHELREREEGFTLIELLVVILIIAILAAIAIPVFLEQRKKGWNAQTQSALKDAATAVESYAVDNNGDYIGLDGEDETGAIDTEGYNGASTVTLAISATSTDYCIVATNASFGGSGDPWEVASYDSDEGEPVEDDAC
jgi:type IV pilus assembly protein PilA